MRDELELEPLILSRKMPPEQVLAWVASLDKRERKAVEDRAIAMEDGFAVALVNYFGDQGVRRAYETWAKATGLKAGPGQPTLRDRFLSVARDPRPAALGDTGAGAGRQGSSGATRRRATRRPGSIGGELAELAELGAWSGGSGRRGAERRGRASGERDLADRRAERSGELAGRGVEFAELGAPCRAERQATGQGR